MKFLVVIRKTGNGYSADAPDVLGCIAAGRTIPAVRRLMKQALALHLDLMAQSGEKLPKPKKRVPLDVDDLGEEDYCTWVHVQVPSPVS